MYSIYPQMHTVWRINPPAAVTAFMYDIHTVKEAVRAGTTQDAQQKRLYRQWANSCSTLLVNPNIQDSPLPSS